MPELIATQQQRILGFNALNTVSENVVVTLSGTAYFVYVGYTVVSCVPKFVVFATGNVGAGAQTAEVGLFSTAAPPNKTNQNLTKIVASGAISDLTTTAFGGASNLVAFGATVPAGTHLWAGMRTAMANTQPQVFGWGIDTVGSVLQTAGAGPLTGAGPFAGVMAFNSFPTVTYPRIVVTLD